MSRGDTALRALGKIAAGLFGAGLLAWAGMTIGSSLGPGPEPCALGERLEEAEIDAATALVAVGTLSALADSLETRLRRIEARAEAAETAAPVAPPRPRPRRKPKPAPAALPPASSHWRF